MQLNRFTVVAHLTRDPEVKVMAGGRRVASFGVSFIGQTAYSPASDRWETEPCFLDCKAFDPPGDRGGRKLATLVEKNLRRGIEVYLEGRLILEKWKAPDGTPRQAVRLLVETVQIIDWRMVAQVSVADAERRDQDERDELVRSGANIADAFPFGANMPDPDEQRFDIPF
jgi:single stranded DNA-binding protein